LRNQLPSELKSGVVRSLFTIVTKQDWSYDAFAKAIGLSSNRLIYYWYNQQKFQTYGTLLKVIDILGVDLKEILDENLF
jgi:transcriptional regulator with XRE-family HTH domain